MLTTLTVLTRCYVDILRSAACNTGRHVASSDFTILTSLTEIITRAPVINTIRSSGIQTLSLVFFPNNELKESLSRPEQEVGPGVRRWDDV